MSKEPKYRRLKRGRWTDLAFVEIDGRRHYLGAYGSAESRERYHRVLAEWNSGSRTFAFEPVVDPKFTVIELVARFLEHAGEHYRRKDGTLTGSFENLKLAFRPLVDLYGRLPAREFGPLKLRTIRQNLVNAGLSRTSVNRRVGAIKHLFKWGASLELVESSVYEQLRTLAGLQRGRTAARDPEPIGPVPPEHVDAVRPYVTTPVWGLIQLQLATGARLGELVIMRRGEIDERGEVWEYRPRAHKTEHHDHERCIFIGPRGQEVIAPFLETKGPCDFVFSPREAIAEHLCRRNEKRATPESCGNVPGSNRKAKRRKEPGERYTTNSYRGAVRRACERAGVPIWTPHQLRHTTATNIRKLYSIEAAKVVCGHRSVDRNFHPRGRRAHGVEYR